jgi:hypothetical protein
MKSNLKKPKLKHLVIEVSNIDWSGVAVLLNILHELRVVLSVGFAHSKQLLIVKKYNRIHKKS